jgi:hypothetical protein
MTCEKSRVVAVAQLSQTDDHGGQAEDDVEKAGNDEQGVDKHDGLSSRDVARILLHGNDVALVILNNLFVTTASSAKTKKSESWKGQGGQEDNNFCKAWRKKGDY